jgi:hypothetical protein
MTIPEPTYVGRFTARATDGTRYTFDAFGPRIWEPASGWVPDAVVSLVCVDPPGARLTWKSPGVYAASSAERPETIVRCLDPEAP